MNVNLSSQINNLRYVIENYGLITGLKMILYHFNIIKQDVRYPYSTLKVSVERGQPLYWKGLETGKITIEQIKFIIDLVEKGDTIIDVGAWIGDLSLLFSHLVGETGAVHAFEPMNDSFSILHKNVLNNNINNIFIHNYALSNVPGEVTLYSSTSTSQQASMRIKKVDKEKENKIKRYTSKSTTIDHFCKTYNIQPNGIKIDVQGEEGNVLKGAIDTIEKYNPWCLLDYHYDLLTDFEIEEIWTYLHNHAYKIIHIEGCENTLKYGEQFPANFIPLTNSRFCIFFK